MKFSILVLALAMGCAHAQLSFNSGSLGLGGGAGSGGFGGSSSGSGWGSSRVSGSSSSSGSGSGASGGSGSGSGWGSSRVSGSSSGSGSGSGSGLLGGVGNLAGQAGSLAGGAVAAHLQQDKEILQAGSAALRQGASIAGQVAGSVGSAARGAGSQAGSSSSQVSVSSHERALAETSERVFQQVHAQLGGNLGAEQQQQLRGQITEKLRGQLSGLEAGSKVNINVNGKQIESFVNSGETEKIVGDLKSEMTKVDGHVDRIREDMEKALARLTSGGLSLDSVRALVSSTGIDFNPLTFLSGNLISAPFNLLQRLVVGAGSVSKGAIDLTTGALNRVIAIVFGPVVQARKAIGGLVGALRRQYMGLIKSFRDQLVTIRAGVNGAQDAKARLALESQLKDLIEQMDKQADLREDVDKLLASQDGRSDLNGDFGSEFGSEFSGQLNGQGQRALASTQQRFQQVQSAIRQAIAANGGRVDVRDILERTGLTDKFEVEAHVSLLVNGRN